MITFKRGEICKNVRIKRNEILQVELGHNLFINKIYKL